MRCSADRWPSVDALEKPELTQEKLNTAYDALKV